MWIKYFCCASLSWAGSSAAHACVLVWNESFMPVVVKPCSPLTSSHCQLPGSASMAGAYMGLYLDKNGAIINESVLACTKTLHPSTLGLQLYISRCLRLWLCLCVCQLSSVSLWEANLSAFAMMCLGNLFPGQPGYQIFSQRLLTGASFVYTFHISVRMEPALNRQWWGPKKKKGHSV